MTHSIDSAQSVNAPLATPQHSETIPSPSVAVGQAGPIEIRSLANIDEIMQLADGDATQQITVSLAGIHQVTSPVQQAFCRLLSEKRDSMRILKTDGHITTDPFEALGSMPASEISDALLIRAAIELGSAWNIYEGTEEDAATLVRSVLDRRRIRCPRDLPNSVKCATSRHRRATSDQPTIASLLGRSGGNPNSLEIDTDLVLPPGWSYDEQHDCLVREYGPMKGESAVSLDGIFFVSQKFVDPTTLEQSVEICWWRHGHLHRHFVARKQVSSAHSAEVLSGLGLPVFSIMSKLWVAYFADFMRANDFRLETLKKPEHLGWQTIDGKKAFALGDTIIIPCDGGSERLPFHADNADPALRTIAAAYCSGGDRSLSLDLLRQVSQLPTVWFAILCSFASVLLEPLRLRLFILDLCGETSSGKTITAIICASMWGRTDCEIDSDDDSSVMQTWNVTRVFVERYTSRLRSLPLFLDDSKQVTVPKNVSDICYDLTNGRNRGRGTIDGIADQASWKLVMISTGEQSLTSFSENAGCRARIITLRGSPFPSRDVEWRRRVEVWRDVAQRNFGFVGAEFVQFVVAHHADWPRWRSRISDLKLELESGYSQNAVAGRHLDYLATITLAAELACDLFGLPDDLKRPVDAVRHLLVAEYDEADRPKEALEQLLDHIAKDPSIIEPVNGLVAPSPQGQKSQAIGKYVQVGDDQRLCRSSIAIFRPCFESLMKEFGFVPDEVLTAWKQKRWLHCDSRRNLKSFRFGGSHPIRTVCLTAEALAELNRQRDAQVGSVGVACSQALPPSSETGNSATSV